MDAWTTEASKQAQVGGYVRAEAISQSWETAARTGKSQAQLNDYLALLEHQIQQREAGPGGLQDLQVEIASLEDVQRMGMDDSPLSPGTTPSSFQMSGGRVRLQPPSLEQTMGQQQNALKSKHLIQNAATGDIAKLQSLLRQRSEVNAVGWDNVTPLMAAARHGREGALQLLLAAKAEIGRTDSYGRTAVDHAQSGSAKHRATIVNYLRGYGGVSGKELKAQVDALARRMFDVESKCSRLNERKSQLPSREALVEYKDLLKRTQTRQGLARQLSRRHSWTGDLTPRGSPLDLTPRGPSDLTPRAFEDDTPSFTMGGFMAGMKAAPMLPPGMTGAPMLPPGMAGGPMLPMPKRW